MAKLAVLVDIGSTFTKASAVNLKVPSLIARVAAPTTAQDVSLGLKDALDKLKVLLIRAGFSAKEIDSARRLACSSAAGGLKMVAIGLVQDLTAKAARLAALGAGARVLKTYSFQLTEEDRREIIELRPDIILLTGGTDGGNSANILHNARVLASLPEGVPVVLAGNRAAAAAVRGCFPQNFSIYTASNVMPQIGKLDVEPAREVIRQVFMEKIIYAKGLARAGGLIEGIFMPTPAAVLRAGRLLSQGSPPLPGWGDLLIVDVGGATTDVHSLGLGLPTKTGVVLRGLPEPLAKRTVEGDLGVRVSVLSLVESIGRERLQKELGLREEELHKLVQRLDQQPESLPQTEIERLFDRALGFHAIRIGVSRHAGTLTESYTPSGQVWIQEGKDLSQVNIIIGTGGVLVNSKEPHAMLRGAQKESNSSLELKPEKPRYFLDANYLLASAGLLSTVYPEAALEILENSLKADELRRRGF